MWKLISIYFLITILIACNSSKTEANIIGEWEYTRSQWLDVTSQENIKEMDSLNSGMRLFFSNDTCKFIKHSSIGNEVLSSESYQWSNNEKKVVINPSKIFQIFELSEDSLKMIISESSNNILVFRRIR